MARRCAAASVTSGGWHRRMSIASRRACRRRTETMATVRIEFETDNAAFSGPAFRREARMVMAAALAAITRVNGRLVTTCGEFWSNLRDSNGNTVGRVEVKE